MNETLVVLIENPVDHLLPYANQVLPKAVAKPQKE